MKILYEIFEGSAALAFGFCIGFLGVGLPLLIIVYLTIKLLEYIL